MGKTESLGTGLAGLEPTTYGLGNRRSIRLSYSPIKASLSPAEAPPSSVSPGLVDRTGKRLRNLLLGKQPR